MILTPHQIETLRIFLADSRPIELREDGDGVLTATIYDHMDRPERQATVRPNGSIIAESPRP